MGYDGEYREEVSGDEINKIEELSGRVIPDSSFFEAVDILLKISLRIIIIIVDILSKNFPW